ncbi:MAG: hypothetical protein V4724_08245 [Pseudomonadota bacterium]
MGSTNRPTKEQVRIWLLERRQAGQPLPDGRQIRQQLGWEYRAPGMRPILNTELLEGST